MKCIQVTVPCTVLQQGVEICCITFDVYAETEQQAIDKVKSFEGSLLDDTPMADVGDWLVQTIEPSEIPPHTI